VENQMAKRPTKLERTAYHEAGHAVAAYSLRWKIIEVSIVPDPDSLGHVTRTPLKDFHPDDDTRFSTLRKGEKEIILYLAEA
jgi:ATP-dependent Zn protease